MVKTTPNSEQCPGISGNQSILLLLLLLRMPLRYYIAARFHITNVIASFEGVEVKENHDDRLLDSVVIVFSQLVIVDDRHVVITTQSQSIIEQVSPDGRSTRYCGIGFISDRLMPNK